MNCKRWLVVMCVCLGLATGFYLVGCGDDDDDGGLECCDAIDAYLAPACQDEGAAAAATLTTCLIPCRDVEDLECDAACEDCTDTCLGQFVADTPSCSAAVAKLFPDDDSPDCGLCVYGAGETFYECLTLDDPDAGVCSDALSAALQVCGDKM